MAVYPAQGEVHRIVLNDRIGSQAESLSDQEVRTMMWGWGAGWGAGWWLVGAVFMVVCMVMMVRMMGHGHSRHGSTDDPERTLADRLARGEIDVEEYNRLLEALRRTHQAART